MTTTQQVVTFLEVFLGLGIGIGVRQIWRHYHPRAPKGPTPTTRYNADVRGTTWIDH
jgi:hypothetical protein